MVVAAGLIRANCRVKFFSSEIFKLCHRRNFLKEFENPHFHFSNRYFSKSIMAESDVKPDMSSTHLMEGDNSPVIKRVKLEGPPVEEEVVTSTSTPTSMDIKTEPLPPVNTEDEAKNPFAYLERDEFSSEHFKIEIRGLPKFFGFKELRKLLDNKLDLNSHKIKAGKGMGCGFAFITFKSEEDKQKALTVLNGYVWKNRTLSAEVAKAVEDPLIRKRALEQVDKDAAGVGSKESIEDTMSRKTIPWFNIPYAEQLQRKMITIKAFASEMKAKILEVNPGLREQFAESNICPIEDIKPSPVTEKYRNKCEYTIGYHPNTNEKMVGFRASSYKAGSVSVGPVSHLIHLPTAMVKVAEKFQDFVRSSSLEPFNPESNDGCWKWMTVRTTRSEQVMISLLIGAKDLNAEQFLNVQNSLIKLFSSMTEPKINSFFLRATERHGEQKRNLPEKLFGEDYITESLLGLKFRISPDAFFQINVPATEVLYTAIGDLLEANPCTTVLDVCCGTGTIGISIAAKCGQVLGIEMVESAVQDCRKNAALNGLSDKCEFFAGKAEDIIDAVIGRAKFENIVAIVDPPRSGVHQRVLLLLRKCEKIKKIIYVSCDAKLAMKNFVDLSRPISKTYRGAPFFPKQIIPVDMFPHCPQQELVIYFERQEEDDVK